MSICSQQRMFDYKVSIIVPMYNAGLYIVDGIESLLNQSIIEEMEIIVVDDHGDDNSRFLVERIKKSHRYGSHLRIIETKKNSGAWAARNLGLEEAKGKWIGFMDADDWCDKFMYENLLNAVELEKSDWGYCCAQKVFENGGSLVIHSLNVKNGELSVIDRKKMLTNGIASFWTGIYNRNFLNINNIRFPNGKFSEDSYFWWTVVMHTKRISNIDFVGYHYRIQKNSVSRRPDNTKAQQKQLIYNSLLSYLRFKGLYDEYKQELDYLYIKKGLIIPLIISAINLPKEINNNAAFIFEVAKEEGIDIYRNKYFSSDFRSRFLLYGFKKYPYLLSNLLRLRYKTDPF